MTLTEETTPKRRQFVDNARLRQELIDWKKACKKAGETLPLTDYIGECILKIAQRLAGKINFCNYTYKEDMISDGIINCIRYMHNYNPAKGTSAFAYITTICYSSFIRRIEIEGKQSAVKAKMIGEGQVAVGYQAGDTHKYPSFTSFDNTKDAPHAIVLERFEAKTQAKKEKNKALRQEKNAAKPKKTPGRKPTKVAA